VDVRENVYTEMLGNYSPACKYRHVPTAKSDRSLRSSWEKRVLHHRRSPPRTSRSHCSCGVHLSASKRSEAIDTMEPALVYEVRNNP